MRFVSYVAPFIFVGILYAVAIPIKDPRSPPSNSAPHQLSTITSTQDQTNLNLNIHPTPLQKRKNEPKTPDEIHRVWVNSAQQSLSDARTELALHKGILTLNEVIPKSKNGGRGPVGPVDPKKQKKDENLRRTTEMDIREALPDHARHLERARALHRGLPNDHPTKTQIANAIRDSERLLKELREKGI